MSKIIIINLQKFIEDVDLSNSYEHFVDGKFTSKKKINSNAKMSNKWHSNITPYQMFRKYFLPFIRCLSGDQEIDSILSKDDNVEITVEIKKIHSWLISYLAKGLVKINNQKHYYKKTTDLDRELFSNLFIQRLMSLSQFRKINDSLVININIICQVVTQLALEIKNPSENISFDDDLEKSRAHDVGLVKNDLKADKAGVPIAKMVDEDIVCYAVIYTRERKFWYHKKISCKPEGEAIVQWFEKLLPIGPYRIFIDSGPMGSFANANYLSLKGRKFVIFVSKIRPKAFWSYMTNKLMLYDLRYRYGKRLIASAYNAGKSKIGKVSNINCIFNEQILAGMSFVRRWSKRDRHYGMVPAGSYLTLYRYKHIFVDVLRNRILRVRNILRNKTKLRAILKDLIYTHLNNCTSLFNILTNQTKPLSIFNFLIRVFSEELKILKENENNIPIAGQYILRTPTLLRTRHQRCCVHCHIHTYWTCSCCQDKTGKPLSICTNGYCNIMQHNPHIKFDTS